MLLWTFSQLVDCVIRTKFLDSNYCKRASSKLSVRMTTRKSSANLGQLLVSLIKELSLGL